MFTLEHCIIEVVHDNLEIYNPAPSDPTQLGDSHLLQVRLQQNQAGGKSRPTKDAVDKIRCRKRTSCSRDDRDV